MISTACYVISCYDIIRGFSYDDCIYKFLQLQISDCNSSCFYVYSFSASVSLKCIACAVNYNVVALDFKGEIVNVICESVDVSSFLNG